MQAVVLLCCAKGIFEHYTGATGIASSGLELSGVAFLLEVAGQFAQIVSIELQEEFYLAL
jgi:hypothetical protein